MYLWQSIWFKIDAHTQRGHDNMYSEPGVWKAIAWQVDYDGWETNLQDPTCL